MTTGFLPDTRLEDMAGRLLARYESLYGAVVCPPVPVERIVEDVLDLRLLWDKIPEPPCESILAALEPQSKTVVLNESRRTLIEETEGLYNTILGHEAGHWEAHFDQGLLTQQPFPELGWESACLYRSSEPSQEPRELQAHRFMGFLLMPSPLLFEAVHGVDLLSWPILYGLRDIFGVTITALKVRLERLGRLYLADDGRMYRSRQEYEGQMPLKL